jgi:hypothetical protein
MNIKNYYLVFFALFTVTFKWSLSFYFFPESLDTKIIHDSVTDAKYYYPLIKYLAEFKLNYSYDPEINNLKVVPLPFWGIFFHSILLKFLSFYSFIVLDFLCVLIILLIFFNIFKILFSSEVSILLSIFIFLLPYIISNSFLYDIKYFYLFSENFYNLRVPRPMITNLYFFGFILVSLKLVTGRFYDIKKFFLLGLILALSLSSFYYHFFAEAIFLFIILVIRFKAKIFIELKNNFKYYFVFLLTFLVVSIPFFLNLYLHESEFTYRQCVFNLDWDIKIKLLKYFVSKYFSLKGIFFIGGISLLTLLGNQIKNLASLDKKVINIFFILFTASLFSPILFLLISPKSCLVYHFVNFTILNAFLFLIVYMIIFFKFIIKVEYKKFYSHLLIFIFILFFALQEFQKISSLMSQKNHINYRSDFNLITKKIEQRYELKSISFLTFEPNFMVWSIMKDIKYLDLNMSIFTSKKDFMIEEDIFSAFRKLGFNVSNFEQFIKNQKRGWRYMNINISDYVYYKYQANSLITFKGSLDFEKDELDHINQSSLLLHQQSIIPRFELSRLKKEFEKFNKKLIFPEVIVLNKKNNFFDYKELSLKSYCKVFDGEFFIMYFKKENTSCEDM